MTTRWCPLGADEHTSFVFSPRFGRTYVLPNEVLAGRALPGLLGLKAANRASALQDPALGVLRGSRQGPVAVPAPSLVSAYRFVHRHRSLAAVSRVLALARLLARLQPRQSWSIADVGALVSAVEQAAGLSDCYPRALITAYLCMRARLDCSLAIGILAPTPQLHAWCATRQMIPYEPEPPHWWYRPLTVIDITW